MDVNHHARGKVGLATRLIELVAIIGSLFLVTITLPFSLCCLFKVVHEYERAVVFRMGRLKGEARGPGKFSDSFASRDHLLNLPLDPPSCSTYSVKRQTVHCRGIMYTIPWQEPSLSYRVSITACGWIWGRCLSTYLRRKCSPRTPLPWASTRLSITA